MGALGEFGTQARQSNQLRRNTNACAKVMGGIKWVCSPLVKAAEKLIAVREFLLEAAAEQVIQVVEKNEPAAIKANRVKALDKVADKVTADSMNLFVSIAKASIDKYGFTEQQREKILNLLKFFETRKNLTEADIPRIGKAVGFNADTSNVLGRFLDGAEFIFSFHLYKNVNNGSRNSLKANLIFPALEGANRLAIKKMVKLGLGVILDAGVCYYGVPIAAGRIEALNPLMGRVSSVAGHLEYARIGLIVAPPMIACGNVVKSYFGQKHRIEKLRNLLPADFEAVDQKFVSMGIDKNKSHLLTNHLLILAMDSTLTMLGQVNLEMAVAVDQILDDRNMLEPVTRTLRFFAEVIINFEGITFGEVVYNGAGPGPARS